MMTILAGCVAVCMTILITYALIPVARKLKLVDVPSEARKVHRVPTPLIGGVSIVITLGLLFGAALYWQPQVMPTISGSKLVALACATAIIFAVGIIDDRYNIRARYHLAGSVIAATIVVASGITIGKITNPFGGVFSFDTIPFIAGGLTFMWLLGMMYSTKLLDGLDGLSTGVTAIGALMIWALTQTHQYYQPTVGFVAFVFAGACIGFLFINFHPARAFLGDGGSVFMGFALGILAIISGSKIATTLLVMGLPIIDVARVIITRYVSGKSIATGDADHLHHLLLANGVSHRMAVVSYYIAGIIFGVTTLFLQSRGKIVALVILLLGGVATAGYLQYRLRKRI